jgi:predicted nucleotidyltransferase
MNITQNHYDRIIELAKQYGAKKLILFGSALEDPDIANDLDLATDIPGWKILRFATQIEDEFRILVDIVPLDNPNRFTKAIERKGKILYESKMI